MATSGSGALFTITEVISAVESAEVLEEVPVTDPKEHRRYKKILSYFAKLNFKIEKRLLETELGKLKSCLEVDAFLHDTKLIHGDQSFLILADDRKALRNYSPYVRMGWRIACQKSPHAGTIADMLGLTGFNVTHEQNSPHDADDLKVFDYRINHLVNFFFSKILH